MKQVKILFEKCKKKLPNRPPDEIDFGLGFRAALMEALKHSDSSLVYPDSAIVGWIEKELQ